MLKKISKLYDKYLIIKGIFLLNILEASPNHPAWDQIWSKAWWLSLTLQERNLDILEDSRGNYYGVKN
jgi:hypothetical protein